MEDVYLSFSPELYLCLNSVMPFVITFSIKKFLIQVKCYAYMQQRCNNLDQEM